MAALHLNKFETRANFSFKKTSVTYRLLKPSALSLRLSMFSLTTEAKFLPVTYWWMRLTFNQTLMYLMLFERKLKALLSSTETNS